MRQLDNFTGLSSDWSSAIVSTGARLSALGGAGADLCFGARFLLILQSRDLLFHADAESRSYIKRERQF